MTVLLSGFGLMYHWCQAPSEAMSFLVVSAASAMKPLVALRAVTRVVILSVEHSWLPSLSFSNANLQEIPWNSFSRFSWVRSSRAWSTGDAKASDRHTKQYNDPASMLANTGWMGEGVNNNRWNGNADKGQHAENHGRTPDFYSLDRAFEKI